MTYGKCHGISKLKNRHLRTRPHFPIFLPFSSPKPHSSSYANTHHNYTHSHNFIVYQILIHYQHLHPFNSIKTTHFHKKSQNPSFPQKLQFLQSFNLYINGERELRGYILRWSCWDAITKHVHITTRMGNYSHKVLRYPLYSHIRNLQ